MTPEELKLDFKRQVNKAVEDYTAEYTKHKAEAAKLGLKTSIENEIQCAFAAGMLLILSALKIKDGPTLPLQISVLHKALREVGDERGWLVTKN